MWLNIWNALGMHRALRRALAGGALAVTVFLGNLATAGDLHQTDAETPAAVEPAADRATLETIFTQWLGQRSDLATCRITYRSFHNSTDGGKSLGEFDNLIDDGQLDSTPEGLRRFITSMNGGPFRVEPPWGEGTIVLRNRQLRNDLGPFSTIEDGDISVYHDSLNRQFDAANPGASAHRCDTPATFRCLPPEPWTLDRWRILDRRPDAVVLGRVVSEPQGGPPVFDSRTFAVDPATGVVIRTSRANALGEIVAAVRYLELTELPGGITFPRIAVEAILQGGVVTVMHACTIETIHVNEPIPDSAFQISARPGSRIVDHRGAHKLVTSLRSDQPDLVDWLKNHAPVAGPRPARKSVEDNSGRNLLLTGNGVLLVVVGIVVWRRQRRPSAVVSD